MVSPQVRTSTATCVECSPITRRSFFLSDSRCRRMWVDRGWPIPPRPRKLAPSVATGRRVSAGDSRRPDRQAEWCGADPGRNGAAGLRDVVLNRLLEVTAQILTLLREKSLRRSSQGARISAKERQIFLWLRYSYGGQRKKISHRPSCQAAASVRGAVLLS